MPQVLKILQNCNDSSVQAASKTVIDHLAGLGSMNFIKGFWIFCILELRFPKLSL